MKIKRKTSLIFILLLTLLISPFWEIPDNIPSVTGTVQVQAAGFSGWKTGRTGKYYYQNSRKLTGLRKIRGYYYAFDSTGKMLTGWQHIRGHYRYFGRQTGRMRINVTVQGRKIDSQGIWTPVVVLDPGHSGVVAGGTEPLGPGSTEQKAKDNPGTQGIATGVPEYKLTLTVAKKLSSLLKKQGCKVYLTRSDHNTARSCRQRAAIANRKKAGAYIRIHANSFTSQQAVGARTVCVTAANPYLTSKQIKSSYALSEAVLNAYVKSTGCFKEKVWETDTMTGNNWSQVPTTLIELGYMSNSDEDRLMQTSAYQQKMIRGISNGIRTFFLK
nr:N-acetylmuramoyl-L-alanine amidase [uncultured Blautia sp.]